MLMSQQTKKTILVGSVKSRAQKLLLKNKQALRAYWPILLLAQLPALIICLILPFKQTVTTFDKKNNADTSKQLVAHIKNIEHRFNELNQRFVALQIQHAKFIKASILLTATVQQGSSPSVNLFKKTTLDTLDRIGEKIRLNEPFSGLLTSLPQECSSFSGYRTLKQFSVRLPLNHQQLKKAFDDIQKNYTPPKIKSNLPRWLEKIASLFQGNIKIEKANQNNEDPFQLIVNALDGQDLKLAYSQAKSIKNQSVELWAKHVAERLSLEEDYSSFAEKVQNWVQQPPIENKIAPIKTTQENIP